MISLLENGPLIQIQENQGVKRRTRIVAIASLICGRPCKIYQQYAKLKYIEVWIQQMMRFSFAIFDQAEYCLAWGWN